MLFEEQQAFVDKVVKARKGMFLLQGGAGTGKTHTVAALIKQLGQHYSTLNVVMTAPTHTAVKILSNFVTTADIKERHISVVTATIHSILGLYVKTYKGKQVLRKKHELAGALYSYDVVVIDEGSMIGNDIWVHLKEALQNYQGIVIFMADIAQLKPVTEYGIAEYSPIFSAIKNVHTLTTSRRTALDNPAFELINKYREASLNNKMLFTVNSNLTQDHKGYMCCDKDLWYKLLVNNTKEAVKLGDLTYVKAVAYTNNRVNDINTVVRGKIYGYDAPQFVDHEYVVAGSVILSPEGNILINNNAEFKVNILREDICHMTRLPVFWVETSVCSTPLKVINFSALAAKDKYFKDLAKKCRTTPALWDKYSEEFNSFADIRYLHAYTAHKCQGATFKYVFIDQHNIATIKDPVDRGAAAYVAVSRATDRIHFY
jgi:nucleoside-triphosphatase THEP1